MYMIICGCSCSPAAELSRCDRDRVACRASNMSHVALYGKNSPIPATCPQTFARVVLFERTEVGLDITGAAADQAPSQPQSHLVAVGGRSCCHHSQQSEERTEAKKSDRVGLRSQAVRSELKLIVSCFVLLSSVSPAPSSGPIPGELPLPLWGNFTLS